MSTRLLSFGKKKTDPKPDLSDKLHCPGLTSKGSKKSNDGEIVDHGNIGTLKYEVYKRGVIRISDDITLNSENSCVFKKDINAFEDEISKTDFDVMAEGEEIIIKGSGDNDNLIFNRVDGDILISLRKRGFNAVEMLQRVLAKGKEKLLEIDA